MKDEYVRMKEGVKGKRSEVKRHGMLSKVGGGGGLDLGSRGRGR